MCLYMVKKHLIVYWIAKCVYSSFFLYETNTEQGMQGTQ